MTLVSVFPGLRIAVAFGATAGLSLLLLILRPFSILNFRGCLSVLLSSVRFVVSLRAPGPPALHDPGLKRQCDYTHLTFPKYRVALSTINGPNCRRELQRRVYKSLAVILSDYGDHY